MNLGKALRIIQQRDKLKRKEEKEMRRQRLLLGNQCANTQNLNRALIQEPYDQKRLVLVQSVFPQEDVFALKEKTKEAHIKGAIAKAVYFYLHNADNAGKDGVEK